MLLTLGLLALIAGMAVIIYNRLVALRLNCRNAFADIDVQLKQRSDLVPNLVETVKGYAGHEKSLLEDITKSRTSAMNAATPQDRLAAEGALSGALGRLFAVSENYPDLKANQNFLSLQSELADLENKIAASRRFLNSATNEYNTAIAQFPAVALAGPMHFTPEAFWQVDDKERQQMSAPPQVKFG